MADKKTPTQIEREYMETLEEWSREKGADDRSLILLAQDIQRRCADGILSEKIHAKLDTPVEVLERLPGIELQALQFQHKILEDNRRRLEKAPPPDTIININVNRRRLEDTINEE